MVSLCFVFISIQLGHFHKLDQEKVNVCMAFTHTAAPDQFGALGKILAGAHCITVNSTTIHSHRHCTALRL